MKKYILFLFTIFCFSSGHGQEARLVIPTGHFQKIQSIDISTDGRLIATGGHDNSVIIWDARTWKQLRTISLRNPVMLVLFSRNAGFLITAEGDAKLGIFSLSFSVWNINSGKLISDLPFNGAAMCTLSPDDKLAVVPFYTERSKDVSFSTGMMTGMLNTTAVWDLSKNKKIELPFNLAVDARIIIYNESYCMLTHRQSAVDGSFKVELWQLPDINNLTADNRPVGKASQPVKSFISKNKIDRIIASPAGRLFATAGKTGIALWDLENTYPLREYKPVRSSIQQLSFSDDGKKLFAYSTSQTGNFVNIWNITDSAKNKSCTFPAISSPTLTKFSPNGNYFISLDNDTAKVFDMQGNPLARLTGHSVSYSNYVFSDNGRFVNTSQKLRRGSMPDNVTDDEVLVSLTNKLVDIEELRKGVNFTKTERDSVYKLFMLPKKPGNANSLSHENKRIWDLQYGTALSSIPDTIHFTTDSISADRKHKLTASYKPTLLQWVGNAFSEISVNNSVIAVSGIKDTSSLMNKIIYDKQSSFNRQSTDVTLLINTQTKDTVYLVALDSTDWIITAPDGYYMASKNGAALLHYAIDNDIISFEQLDLRNNRPDKILEKIGYANKNLIGAYRKAYEKRIEKFGIDTSYFHDRLTVPRADILNKDDIGYLQKNEKLSLRIRGVEGKNKLKWFNVWVNHVPVYGMRGIDIGWHNKKDFDTAVTITLSQGDNRIETSVLNAAGIESYRSPVFVKYLPLQPRKEKVYFAGIGINRFADSSNNLQYCRKDIRDLCLQVREKYGERLVVDTIFDENVTVQNVRALKKKLLQSEEDDKVMIAYSGHGLLSKRYDYYLSTYNINFSQPEQNGLPYEELENLADGIRARKKLMLIDACHSGELDKEEMRRISAQREDLQKKNSIKEYSKGLGIPVKKDGLGMKNSFELMQELFVNTGRSTGTSIISAAAGTQFALERGDLKNGVFTYSILEVMRNKPTVKVSELKKIVRKRVEQLTNGLQKPTSRNEIVGVDWDVW